MLPCNSLDESLAGGRKSAVTRPVGRSSNAEELDPADGQNMLRKKSAVNWGV